MKKEYIEINYNGKTSRIHKDLAIMLFTNICYSNEAFENHKMLHTLEQSRDLKEEFDNELNKIFY